MRSIGRRAIVARYGLSVSNDSHSNDSHAAGGELRDVQNAPATDVRASGSGPANLGQPHGGEAVTGEPAAMSKAWRWLAVAATIYLLICAVSIVGRGFRALGGDAAETLFGFASNPLVALCVGILATVLIQSSTTTTAITVAAVGAGALSVHGAIPIVIGSNLGTTVTCTFVALGFVGNREEFRRALAASTIHDFFNLLALLLIFPIEVIFHPLERLSDGLAQLLQGSVLPDPSNANFVSALTRPFVSLVTGVTLRPDGVLGASLTVLTGVALIFLAVRLLSANLKVLMVGSARRVLTNAVGRNAALAMATGTGVTVITQSSTVTNSILVPFVGSGALTPRQIYPVTLGANLGTTFTALLAAFAVTGGNSLIALQVAFVHVLYNVIAILLIFVIPLLRPLPLYCAETLARYAAQNKAILAAYIITVFIVLPAIVILSALVFW